MSMNTKQIATYLRTTANELETAEARADGVDKANKILNESNAALAAQVAALKEVNDMIETDRAVVQQELSAAKDTANSLKASLNEALEVAAVKSEQAARAHTRIQSLERQLDAIKQIETQQGLREEELRAEVDRLQQVIKTLHERLGRYQTAALDDENVRAAIELVRAELNPILADENRRLMEHLNAANAANNVMGQTIDRQQREIDAWVKHAHEIALKLDRGPDISYLVSPKDCFVAGITKQMEEA